MQSVTHTDHYAQDAATPVRPEPLVSDRLARVYRGFPNREGQGRAGLAAAFRRLDRSVSPRKAYERVKDFYRSSGHDWTRGLSR